jgi:preprotein translocase subunit YajC
MWALTLFAEGAAPAAGEGGGLWQQLGGFAPILFIVLIGYFLLLRPARMQEKQRQALVSAIKRNDRIVNSGGIIGVVESIKDEEVALKGGLRITKSSIVRVVTDDSAKEAEK